MRGVCRGAFERGKSFRVEPLISRHAALRQREHPGRLRPPAERGRLLICICSICYRRFTRDANRINRFSNGLRNGLFFGCLGGTQRQNSARRYRHRVGQWRGFSGARYLPSMARSGTFRVLSHSAPLGGSDALHQEVMVEFMKTGTVSRRTIQLPRLEFKPLVSTDRKE